MQKAGAPTENSEQADSQDTRDTETTPVQNWYIFK
jgi:hypothetical protein